MLFLVLELNINIFMLFKGGDKFLANLIPPIFVHEIFGKK